MIASGILWWPKTNISIIVSIFAFFFVLSGLVLMDFWGRSFWRSLRTLSMVISRQISSKSLEKDLKDHRAAAFTSLLLLNAGLLSFISAVFLLSYFSILEYTQITAMSLVPIPLLVLSVILNSLWVARRRELREEKRNSRKKWKL